MLVLCYILLVPFVYICSQISHLMNPNEPGGANHKDYRRNSKLAPAQRVGNEPGGANHINRTNQRDQRRLEEKQKVVPVSRRTIVVAKYASCSQCGRRVKKSAQFCSRRCRKNYDIAQWELEKDMRELMRPVGSNKLTKDVLP